MKNRVFLLEENIIRAYALVQSHVFYIIRESKYSLGELAKKNKMDRATFTKKFKQQEWTAKELYDLLDLLNTEFSNTLQEKTEELKNKK